MPDITTRTCKPSITIDDLSASIIDGLTGSTRALLVSREECGRFRIDPVFYGESVLNIGRDLVSHLNEFPHPDAWLQELQTSICMRIARRQQSAIDGGLSIPRNSSWEP